MNNDEAWLAGYRFASNSWSDEYETFKRVKPEAQASKGFCYILHLEDTDKVKIGFSHTKESLIERWKILSLEYLYKVHPVSVEPGGFFREQFLHRVYHKYRIPGPGEVFYLSDMIKDHIEMTLYNRLVLPQIEEWYGESFFKPSLIGTVDKTPSNLKGIKLLKHNNNSSYSRYISTIEHKETIEVYGSIDVNGLVSKVKDNLLFLEEEKLERRVWSMEF